MAESSIRSSCIIKVSLPPQRAVQPILQNHKPKGKPKKSVGTVWCTDYTHAKAPRFDLSQWHCATYVIVGRHKSVLKNDDWRRFIKPSILGITCQTFVSHLVTYTTQLLSVTHITRATVFPRKISPNSAAHSFEFREKSTALQSKMSYISWRDIAMFLHIFYAIMLRVNASMAYCCTKWWMTGLAVQSKSLSKSCHVT